MSRSFLLAVSGFALLAACADPDDSAMRDSDEAVLDQSSVGLLEDNETLDDGSAETDVTDDLDSYQNDMPGSDGELGDPMADSDAMTDDAMTDDDGEPIIDNPDAEADVMADSRMSDFNTDFAGMWGTEQQCGGSGSTWAISESLISTPSNVVCTVTGIEEGAGQAVVTATCSGETADGEIMEDSEQTFTLAAQDDGTITVNHRTEETVERCM
ncbi:hypothetical protein [Hyphobacterium marinum]|uniref:DUF4333 domain-containing protein n=1 Tax=Hyphobacterium marinum TaxID=3116574 RepID=A0ABU7LWY2_9PROT|nr:hypothetical protein [Hyphobacterium sp. Y6023]MEE2566034.1 hypothetical protein [Hyphobacterium sp. Y6023]